jgi:DNA-binding transcriptional LysR family regulator
VGAELLTYVRRMFGSYDEAVSYLQEVQGLRQGTLRIGSYGPYGVIQMMARYRERYPGISISITFANSSDLALRLLQYDLDVALMTNIEHHPEFQVTPFSRPPMVVIAPRTEQWKRRQSLTRDQFLRQTLICREPGSAVRAAFDHYVGANRPPPDRLIEISSREGVVGAVAEGLGLAMIFDEGILPERRVIKVNVRGMDVRSKVDIVCLAERRRSPPIAGFLSVAHEIAGENAGGRRRVGQSDAV